MKAVEKFKLFRNSCGRIAYIRVGKDGLTEYESIGGFGGAGVAGSDGVAASSARIRSDVRDICCGRAGARAVRPAGRTSIELFIIAVLKDILVTFDQRINLHCCGCVIVSGILE